MSQSTMSQMSQADAHNLDDLRERQELRAEPTSYDAALDAKANLACNHLRRKGYGMADAPFDAVRHFCQRYNRFTPAETIALRFELECIEKAN